MMQNDEKLVSALDLAYRANLHPTTIYRKALRGEIPGIVRLGKTIRFRKSAIDGWLSGITEENDGGGDR